jgi:Mor family transcriptional regulator
MNSTIDKIRRNKLTASKLNAKLTKEEVFNLILDKENGMSYSEISKKYKISNSCAYEIVIGKTYKWVWDEK